MMVNKKFFMMLFLIVVFLVTVNIVTARPQCDCENEYDCSSYDFCDIDADCSKYITPDVVHIGLCRRLCQDTCYATSCPNGWEQAQGFCEFPGEVCCRLIPPTCEGYANDFDCGSCSSSSGDCGTCCNEILDHVELDDCECWPIEMGCKFGGMVEADDEECGGCWGDICCCRETLIYRYENKACSAVNAGDDCNLCCCYDEGQACGSDSDCCQVSPDDWCDTSAGVCCPVGDYWDGVCIDGEPCSPAANPATGAGISGNQCCCYTYDIWGGNYYTWWGISVY